MLPPPPRSTLSPYPTLFRSKQNWICSFGVTLDWTSNSDNTNTIYITDSNWALMGDYVAKSVKSFVCPGDSFFCAAQKNLGWSSRMRSCAMNGAIGDGLKWFAPGNGGN